MIQSYLKRSEKDVEELLAERIRIRLCKGAYKEPPSIAYESKADVDANYVKLMKMLLKSDTYHGLATHDENIIRRSPGVRTREKIARDSFEFQMLHGIRRDLQQPGQRWLAHARVCSVRHGMVSLLHAALGRAPGERVLYRPQYAPIVDFTITPVLRRRCHALARPGQSRGSDDC